MMNATIKVKLNGKWRQEGEGAAAAFMQEFNSLTCDVPLRGMRSLGTDDTAVWFELYPEWPTVVDVAGIKALTPRKGHGAKALQWLCELADKHGITLTLDVVFRFSGESPTMPQLRAWYRKFGFKFDRHYHGRRAPQ